VISLIDKCTLPEDAEALVKAQKAEAKKLRVKRKAVQKEIKKHARKRQGLRNKCKNLATDQLIAELKMRAEHKAKVDARLSTSASADEASEGKR
jgi:DNA-directed RNA polymerase alpha subunit